MRTVAESMGHPERHMLVERLARRFSAWRDQASRYHRLLRQLADHVTEVERPGDATVTVRVSETTWRAIREAAAEPPPEPADPLQIPERP
jgi:hypothetical protein